MLRYLSSPFKWFFKLEAASGLVLLFAAEIALYISNSNISDLKSLSMSCVHTGQSSCFSKFPFRIIERIC